MTSPASPADPPRRGRPTDVDPERVALLALRHFDEHGYEETTMDDIAALARIGRRTLFRYFPSKPALVWGGLEPVVGRLHGVLDAAGDDEPLREVLAHAVTESLTLTPEAQEATRRRLALMGTHPALIGYGLSAVAANRGILVGFLARRLGEDPEGLRAQVLADALGSAIFSGLLWWARTGAASPAEVVNAALDEVLCGRPPDE